MPHGVYLSSGLKPTTPKSLPTGRGVWALFCLNFDKVAAPDERVNTKFASQQSANRMML